MDQATHRMTFLNSVKQALKAKGFVVLLWTFSSFVGVFTAFGALMSNIITPYGFTNKEAGFMGAVVIAGGLLGAGLVGPMVDYTGRHSLILKSIIPFSAAAFASMIFVGTSRGCIY
jgi:FLVCR family MFS transporter 7